MVKQSKFNRVEDPLKEIDRPSPWGAIVVAVLCLCFFPLVYALGVLVRWWLG